MPCDNSGSVLAGVRGLAIALLALLAMLVGCDQQSVATATQPTAPPSPPPSVTPAPTSTPYPTVTQTASPTATRTATSTRQPTATACPTVTPSPTATAEPTTPPPATSGAALSSPVATAAPAVAVAAQPKGAPLTYQPVFPAVSPAQQPPLYDAYTNPLTGVRVGDSALAQRRPIVVRYGNDRAARPHAGISQADVVMEEVMDAWWITRLAAVFLQEEPAQVGPVRSARPANIEMLPAFDGVFVYSGASVGVMQLLAQQSFDLIHEGREGDLFYRSATRSSPHNLFTSIAAIRQRLAVRGIERPVTLRGWTFSAEAPVGEAAQRVEIPYPSTSTVTWTWDGSAGVYRRWVQGEAYTDLNTGQQLGCANVIILYARHWESDIVEDSRGATAIGIALRGGERVQIVRDGRVIEGYWWRAEAHWLPQFIDANGQHIPLKPGRSWIQIVPNTYRVGVR